MNRIFWAIFGAAILHVVEEYLFPGGFMRTMKNFRPKYSAFVTVPFAIIVNGIFLVMCLAAALFAARRPLFSLAIAATVFLNGLIHVGAAARLKGYAPGVLSGVILYLPLGFVAFLQAGARGGLSFGRGLIAGAMALFFQAVPIAYLGLSRLLRRT